MERKCLWTYQSKLSGESVCVSRGYLSEKKITELECKLADVLGEESCDETKNGKEKLIESIGVLTCVESEWKLSKII